MPRKATGTTFQDRSGRWYARVTLGPGAKDRPGFALPEGFSASAAEARKEVLAGLAARLRAGKVPRDVAEGLLERAAARDGQELQHVLRAADKVIAGEVVIDHRPSADLTFEALARQWTSGELHRLHPKHVAPKKDPRKDAGALGKHVYPIVGHVRIVDFTIDHADAVLRALPPELEPSTVREIAGRMLRVLSLAVYPLRIIKATPIPRGWMPRRGPTKAKGYLYPDEDRKLLACVDVPLCWRVIFGFLTREGPRFQEAAALSWSDFNLDAGTVSLDATKTDEARDWLLGADVVRALRVAHLPPPDSRRRGRDPRCTGLCQR